MSHNFISVEKVEHAHLQLTQDKVGHFYRQITLTGQHVMNVGL